MPAPLHHPAPAAGTRSNMITSQHLICRMGADDDRSYGENQQSSAPAALRRRKYSIYACVCSQSHTPPSDQGLPKSGAPELVCSQWREMRCKNSAASRAEAALVTPGGSPGLPESGAMCPRIMCMCRFTIVYVTQEHIDYVGAGVVL